MSILRIIDFAQLDANTEYFLSQFIVNFLTVSTDDVFAACVARIGSDPDKMAVRDGLIVFLKSYIKPRGQTCSEGACEEDVQVSGSFRKY